MHAKRIEKSNVGENAPSGREGEPGISGRRAWGVKWSSTLQAAGAMTPPNRNRYLTHTRQEETTKPALAKEKEKEKRRSADASRGKEWTEQSSRYICRKKTAPEEETKSLGMYENAIVQSKVPSKIMNRSVGKKKNTGVHLR